jgi:hypothetical protein
MAMSGSLKTLFESRTSTTKTTSVVFVPPSLFKVDGKSLVLKYRFTEPSFQMNLKKSNMKKKKKYSKMMMMFFLYQVMMMKLLKHLNLEHLLFMTDFDLLRQKKKSRTQTAMICEYDLFFFFVKLIISFQ